MKNKRIMLLLLVMMFCMPLGVKAATLQKFPIQFQVGSYDMFITKLYKEEGKYDGGYHIPLAPQAITQFFAVDHKAAYCIDWGTSLGGNIGSTHSSWDSPQDLIDAGNLQTYLQNKVENVDETIKKLNLIYYFGYNADLTGVGSSQISATNLKRFLATQALLWETLSDDGMYANVSRKQMDDIYTTSELDAMFATKDTNSFGRLTDIGFYKVSGNTTSDYWPLIPPQSNLNNDYIVEDVANYKQEIKSRISAAKYDTLPSICGKTYTIEIGKSQELVDGNHILNEYTRTCGQGITCSAISNNKFTVIAGSNAQQNVVITLNRTFNNVGATTAKVYKVVEGGQGVVTLGNLAPKECTVTVKVNAPKPGCYICGSDYKWGKPGDEGIDEENCELQESVETEANCKPNLACYKCEEDGTFKYRWGRLGDEGIDEESCELQEDIDELDNCKDPIPSEAPPSSEPEESSPPTAGLRIAYVSLVCGFAAAIAFVYFYSKKPMDE